MSFNKEQEMVIRSLEDLALRELRTSGFHLLSCLEKMLKISMGDIPAVVEAAKRAFMQLNNRGNNDWLLSPIFEIIFAGQSKPTSLEQMNDSVKNLFHSFGYDTTFCFLLGQGFVKEDIDQYLKGIGLIDPRSVGSGW